MRYIPYRARPTDRGFTPSLKRALASCVPHRGQNIIGRVAAQPNGTGHLRNASGTRAHSSAGFTLIELLVVVAIIGMLASVIIASLGNVRVKGRDARRIADLTQIRTALELYYSTNDQYPSNGYWTCSFDNATWSSLQTALAPYIKVLPEDPLNTGYPWVTGSYGYCYGRVSEDEYDLVTQFEDPNNPNRCAVNGWLFRLADPDASWCALGYSPYIYADH